MRNNVIAIIAVIGVISVVGLWGAALQSQQAAQRGRGAAAAAAVPDAPTNKTAFWTNEQIQAKWKDNETKHVNNSRLFNGPTNISANVRIVLDQRFGRDVGQGQTHEPKRHRDRADRF